MGTILSFHGCIFDDIEFHEPCVLPDGIVDDVLSPIKVNVTHARDVDNNGGPLETTTLIGADKNDLEHEIPEEPEDTKSEHDGEHTDHSYGHDEGTHCDMGIYESLLKPDDTDAQYISDEDLIEKGDFVKGEREDSEEYLQESDEYHIPSSSPDDDVEVEKSDKNDDEIIESGDHREDADADLEARYVDESVDEFLELEKQLAAECDQTDSGIPSDIEHGPEELATGYDEYMQAIQDLSSQKNKQDEEISDSDDEANSDGINENEYADTQSDLPQNYTKETGIDKIDNSDIEESVDRQATEYQQGQELNDVNEESNIVSMEEERDDNTNQGTMGYSSEPHADLQSGIGSIDKDGAIDTEKDSESDSYQCSSELAESAANMSDCDKSALLETRDLKDENTTDKSADGEQREKQDHLDTNVEKNDNVLESDCEKQGMECGSLGSPEFSSDDKEEKCKLS